MISFQKKKYINGNCYFDFTYVKLEPQHFAQGYIENVETKMGMNETPELDPYTNISYHVQSPWASLTGILLE